MRRFFSYTVFVVIASARTDSAAQKRATWEDGPELAEKVHAIFEAKCVDCHGPELPRPKGKFGSVLDLKRLAEIPDYVVKGRPEEPELHVMARDDEMRGEDAN